MNTKSNVVAWCMDSLRWDIFCEADTPSFDRFAKFKMVHSRAGVTVPSLFASFMNLSWYGSNGAVLAPQFNRWCWVPREFSRDGYYNVFITGNPMFKIYKDVFGRFFDEYIDVGGGYQADRMVDIILETYDVVEKPKFIFMLFMETHQPYHYRRGLTEAYTNAQYRSITRQIKSMWALDREFARFTERIGGTDTDVVAFSDHGDLDLHIEGHQGHGPALFHPKLFEIPLGRATI